jgi:hypothetical protein
MRMHNAAFRSRVQRAQIRFDTVLYCCATPFILRLKDRKTIYTGVSKV